MTIFCQFPLATVWVCCTFGNISFIILLCRAHILKSTALLEWRCQLESPGSNGTGSHPRFASHRCSASFLPCFRSRSPSASSWVKPSVLSSSKRKVYLLPDLMAHSLNKLKMVTLLDSAVSVNQVW